MYKVQYKQTFNSNYIVRHSHQLRLESHHVLCLRGGGGGGGGGVGWQYILLISRGVFIILRSPKKGNPMRFVSHPTL